MFILLVMMAMMFLMLSLMMINNNWLISLDISIWTMNNINIMSSMLLDWMAIMFMSTVMMISSMILIFSTAYIPKNEYKQFSMILMCFVMSMMILISSENIIFILLGWDGLGLSSYMLVIYYQNFSSASSGMITILSNRLGDVALLLTIGIMMTKLNWNFIMNETYYKITLMLLIIAAISKSAQFPFSAWLPAAMAAPTPISALVHSSTLVTAGVYLLMRVMNNLHPMSMFILIILSSATTIYASLSANWEQDMKKIIALSTLSQIGLMMFAISMGTIGMAFFHLITHALFKSTMFMTAGMMIHNYSYQDMRHMSLMNYTSPIPPMIMMTSSMALMGIPFMSSFYSKDAIIEFSLNSKLISFLTFMMILSIGMTSMYSLRMFKTSMKLIMKMKKDNMYMNSMMLEIPLLIMIPYSIMSGTFILWISTPTQIFLISSMTKMLILLVLSLGFFMSLIMNFNSNMFMKLSKMPSTLWFMNYLSSLPTKMFYLIMMKFQKNDKNWQEKYGPTSMYFLMKENSYLFTYLITKPLFIFLIMMMTPMLIMLM